MRIKVTLMVHPFLRPDIKLRQSPTEYDVWRGLLKLGYQVEIFSEQDRIENLERHLVHFKPHVVFNLLEEFRGEAVYDFHMVSYLEAKGVPFTGCNPRGLALTRNKFLSLNALAQMGCKVPAQALVRGTRSPLGCWPRVLKFNREHASLSITQKNIVRTEAARAKEMKRMARTFGGEILEQEFIRGEEVTVSVWGNAKPQAFPAWKLHLGKSDQIATQKLKFNPRYRRRQGIRAGVYQGPLQSQLMRLATKAFLNMDLSGYARFDFRIREGIPFLIDINPNPNLSRNEDFACAGRSAGFSYLDLIGGIVDLARRYQPRR